MSMKIWDKEHKEFVNSQTELCAYAGFNLQKYEGIGVMSDGQPVVFDTCGNFGYLDNGRFEAVFSIGCQP